MYSNQIAQWNLADYEIGIYLPKHGSASKSTLKLLIPKLNPFQNANETPWKSPKHASINSSIFINSSECRVRPSSQINLINYFEVPVRHGVTFKGDHFKHGDRLKIEVINGDIYEMYVIGDLDPSHEATKDCPPLTD